MTTENSKSAAKKRWYVIQAFSGYELRVRETLLQSIEQNEEMKELIDEVLVPTMVRSVSLSVNSSLDMFSFIWL